MLDNSSKRWDRWPAASEQPAIRLYIGALGMLAAAIVLGRAGLLTQGLLFCPFQRLSGLPCPLCGITRAWEALTRGDMLAALTLHPFAILIPPALVAVALGWRPGPKVFLALAAALACFGIVRIALLTL